MTVVFNVHFKHYSVCWLTKRWTLRSTMTVFNWNERDTNNIFCLGSNSNKKNTNVCHETMIIFQCIQIGKLELVKILGLPWIGAHASIRSEILSTPLTNDERVWSFLWKCNVFGMQEVSSSSIHYKNLVHDLICEWDLWMLQYFIEINLSVKSQNVQYSLSNHVCIAYHLR